MAKAEVAYTYTTGETVACIVTAKAEHPDALDQVATRARRLFAEVVEDMKMDEADEQAHLSDTGLPEPD